MIVQGLANITSFYRAASPHNAAGERQISPAPTENHADKVSISAAARALMSGSQAATGDAEVQERIAEIKSRPAVERSEADFEYLAKHDQRYTELLEKIKAYGLNGTDALTADEMDYMQKAGGMVNTMAYLSSGEKALYDELRAQGNHEAANGLLLVGMSRIGMEGRQVTLPNGKSFAPTETEVTAANIRNLFKYLFVDPEGNTDRAFEALASYLDKREATDQGKSQV